MRTGKILTVLVILASFAVILTQTLEAKEVRKGSENVEWAIKIAAGIEKEMKKVKTPEDANLLVQVKFGEFINKYYFPTDGKPGPYGITVKDYSQDELEIILAKANELKNMFQKLADKFSSIPDYYKKEIEKLIKHLEEKLSLAGRMQKEILENALEILER